MYDMIVLDGRHAVRKSIVRQFVASGGKVHVLMDDGRSIAVYPRDRGEDDERGLLNVLVEEMGR